MGYESRIYVVNKADFGESTLCWAEEIAQFNLCCVDGFVLDNIHKCGKPTTCWFESDDEGNPITTDQYGDVITEMTLSDAIEVFKNAVDNSDYRRYQPCLVMLESFAKGVLYGQWGENLVVLHYGY